MEFYSRLLRNIQHVKKRSKPLKFIALTKRNEKCVINIYGASTKFEV